jgi:hypothetical protein
MYKHIFANGCSNTCAIDPEQIDKHDINAHKITVRHDLVYPGRIREKLNIPEYTNMALGGGSNDRIVRTTIKWLNDNYITQHRDTQELLVIIGWTQYYRREFTWSDKSEVRENTFDTPFYPFNRFWPGALEVKENEYFTGDCLEYWKMHVSYGCNDYFEQTKWMNQIIGLQSFLKSHNIAHIFVNTAGYFTFSELKLLANLVDEKHYYNMWDPNLKTANMRPRKVLFGREFEHQFKIGWNGHFGPDFHEHFSDILIDFMIRRSKTHDFSRGM